MRAQRRNLPCGLQGRRHRRRSTYTLSRKHSTDSCLCHWMLRRYGQSARASRWRILLAELLTVDGVGLSAAPVRGERVVLVVHLLPWILAEHTPRYNVAVRASACFVELEGTQDKDQGKIHHSCMSQPRAPLSAPLGPFPTHRSQETMS